MPFWNKKTETRLIIGLGNPGEKYAGSRHNIGFMCVDKFAKMQNIDFKRSQSRAKIAEGRIGGYDIVLAKPQTFMNLSGESVGRLVRKFKVKTENLIVIHDDLDLPLGRVRIRLGGSSAGHKGINSTVQHLGGNQNFVRVRVGIGRPNGLESGKSDEDEVITYVLGAFSPEEKTIINDVIVGASEVLQSLLVEGLTATMNKFNGIDYRKK